MKGPLIGGLFHLTAVAFRPVTILCVLVFLIGPMAAVARQGVVPLLFGILLALCFVPDARTAWRGLAKSQLLFFAAPLTLWALISNIWAPVAQWSAWLQLVATIVAGVLVATGFGSLAADAVARVLKAAVFGIIALLVFLLEEGLTRAAILSWVRPDDVQNSDALFFSLILSLAARGTAVLAVTGFSIAVAIYIFTRSKVLAVLFFGAALLACVRLPMTTSVLGLLAAAAAASCVYWRPKLFLGLMLAGMGVVILAAGPAAQLIPDARHRTAAENQLELGAQHRLDVWRYVSDLSAAQPIIGHGFNASRYYAARQEKIAHSGLPALPTHPHNAALQLWLELGAVGAVLAVVLVYGAWRTFARALQPSAFLSNAQCAVIAGLIAPALVIACFSFSVWSTWWIAALGLSSALVRLVNKSPALRAPE